VSPQPPPGVRKRCTVAFGLRERQYLWSVELPASARIADALAAARAQAPADLAAEIPWDCAPVGVFGEPRSRSDSCEDGDRIERAAPRARRARAPRRQAQRLAG